MEQLNAFLSDFAKEIATQAADIVMQRIQPLLKPEEEYIERTKVLEMLNIDSSTLYKWEQQGKLVRHGKIGGKIYYNRSDVERAMTN